MLKILAKQVKEFKKPSIIAASCTIAEVALEIALPMVTASIIDKGIQTGELKNVFFYGFIMLCLAAASLTMGILAGRFSAEASTGFAKNLRMRCITKFRPIPLRILTNFLLQVL